MQNTWPEPEPEPEPKPKPIQNELRQPEIVLKMAVNIFLLTHLPAYSQPSSRPSQEAREK